MDGKTCVECRDPVDLAGSIQHKCLHRTHGLCLRQKAQERGEQVDLYKCAACKGHVNLNEPLLPANEPDTYRGVDYIENPVQSTSVFSRVKKATKNWVNVNKEDTEDVHYLIGLGPQACPVDWLIRTKENMGLQRLLAEHVTIDDMLASGYTWSDLCVFKDIRGGGERAIKALNALRVDATHFRDFPEVFNFDAVNASIGNCLTPRHMVEVFGLHFPDDGGPMQVAQKPRDTKGWTAEQLVQFHFGSEDLIGAGMTWLEQYEALYPTDETEQALLGNAVEVTQFLNQLPSIEETIQSQQQQLQSPVVVQEEHEPHYVEVTAPAGYAPRVMPVLNRQEVQRQVIVMQPTVNQRRGGFGHGLRKNRRK